MDNKTALVTGGNKGIGFAVCKGLAQAGFHVFLAARNEKHGQEACAKLKREGLNVDCVLLDVSKPSSIHDAVAALTKQSSRLDLLVNNAGVYLDKEANALTVDPKVIEATFDTNTMGPLLVTRAVLPLLKAAGHAQIINVSSGMGQLSDMGGESLAYRLSKTALNAVTRILSHEVAPFGIAVNSVCPGWVHTDMGGKEAPRTPEQGADTILWLATGNTHVTGHFFRDRTEIAW